MEWGPHYSFMCGVILWLILAGKGDQHTNMGLWSILVCPALVSLPLPLGTSGVQSFCVPFSHSEVLPTQTGRMCTSGTLTPCPTGEVTGQGHRVRQEQWQALPSGLLPPNPDEALLQSPHDLSGCPTFWCLWATPEEEEFSWATH